MSGLKFDFSNMMQGLEALQPKLDIGLEMFAKSKAQYLEDEAKRNRPWTDRTNDARQRLKGSYKRTVTGYRIELAHGAYHGIYLELAHEKRFAIIEPTIKLCSPKIMKDFKGMMNQLK